MIDCCNKLFLLSVIAIALISFTIQDAFAIEYGANYDLEQLTEKQFRWTSHYERIWDGNQWVNYILTDDTDKIKVKGGNIDFELNKSDCSFRLLNPDTNEISIEKYEKQIQIDSSDVVLGTCTIDSIEQLTDGIKITTIQDASGSEIKTIYDVMSGRLVEWTYEITNNELINSKTFTIAEKCINCVAEKTDGDLLYLGDYVLNTKNQDHNKLKSISESKDIVLEFQDTSDGMFDKIIIDPIFSSSAPTEDFYLRDEDNDNNCENFPDSVAESNQLIVGMPTSATVYDCLRSFFEYNTSSLEQYIIDVTDSDFTYAVSSIQGTGADACDYWTIPLQITTTGDNLDIWESIVSGTQFVESDTTCKTAGNNKSVDLGTTFDDFFENQYDNGYVAFAIKANTETPQDATQHYSILCDSGAVCTPDPTLTITFTILPPPMKILQSINVDFIGDMARINGDITVTNSTWANLTSIKLYINDTLIHTNTTGQNKTTQYGAFGISYGNIWNHTSVGNLFNFSLQTQAQNSSLTLTNTTYILTPNDYNPIYNSSISFGGDYTELINYTITLNDVDLLLKINRLALQQSNQTWNAECNFLTGSDYKNGGTWINQTGVYAYNQTYDTQGTSIVYIFCYNDNKLFQTIFFGNNTGLNAGLSGVENSLGTFFGLPLIFMFILFMASLYSGNRAGMGLLVTMIVIGILSSLGAFALEENIWGIILVIASIGLFALRKIL